MLTSIAHPGMYIVYCGCHDTAIAPCHYYADFNCTSRHVLSLAITPCMGLCSLGAEICRTLRILISFRENLSILWALRCVMYLTHQQNAQLWSQFVLRWVQQIQILGPQIVDYCWTGNSAVKQDLNASAVVSGGRMSSVGGKG